MYSPPDVRRLSVYDVPNDIQVIYTCIDDHQFNPVDGIQLIKLLALTLLHPVLPSSSLSLPLTGFVVLDKRVRVKRLEQFVENLVEKIRSTNNVK